jgi:hypothetical protein
VFLKPKGLRRQKGEEINSRRRKKLLEREIEEELRESEYEERGGGER